jgi:hypothetical protein
MPLLTEYQLIDIVDMIVDGYGSRLTGGEVSEIAALILKNISGFETVDSRTLTQTINEIRRLYSERVLRVRFNNPGMSDLLLFVPICDIVRFVKIEPLLRAPWIAG